MNPILSICIPTYNRQKFLQLTLEHLIPQLNDKVEVLVFDNGSTDETIAYLQSLDFPINFFSQSSNVGPDLNMIDCLQGGSGRYIWMLCDDDLPYVNAVDEILKGIESNNYPPFLFITALPSDPLISQYSDEPSKGGWSVYNRNSFLNRVLCQCTFAPSIVVKRDCLNINFIKDHIGSYLVPAATTLSTVGVHNRVCVSDYPLLFARGENSGGYNTFRVFTKEYSSLLRKCRKFGYSHTALNKAYEDVLRVVIFPAIIREWKIGFMGMLHLLVYSFKFKFFYRVIIRALIWRKLKGTSIFDSLQVVKNFVIKNFAF